MVNINSDQFPPDLAQTCHQFFSPGSLLAKTKASMHFSKTLLPSLLGLFLSANAACLQAQQSGWHGPGFYGLINRATGTAVDLYNGGAVDGTPIVGWCVLDVFLIPSANIS